MSSTATRHWSRRSRRGGGANWIDLTARQRALCTVAEKMSATPTRMTEEDWQPLRDLGFDDRACLEVAHIVGIFNYLTRLADGLGLQLDPATRAAAEGGPALERPKSEDDGAQRTQRTQRHRERSMGYIQVRMSASD